MVTDAAGTGFEIKKPHKGTETLPRQRSVADLRGFEIKKPHKGTETIQVFSVCYVNHSYLKLRNPIRGRKLAASRPLRELLVSI